MRPRRQLTEPMFHQELRMARWTEWAMDNCRGSLLSQLQVAIEEELLQPQKDIIKEMVGDND